MGCSKVVQMANWMVVASVANLVATWGVQMAGV